MLRRSACEQPPSGPRDGCDEFHDLRRVIVTQALSIVVAEHDRPLRAARVVLAGHVLVGGKGFAVRGRAGENVMAVRRVAAAVDDLAFFRQIVLLGELVVGTVQVVDARGDDHALGIHPGALADAVARVHGAVTLRRQISVPGLGARARPIAASCWQCLSAPASPPRSAPLPGPALVTKNVIFACCADAGATHRNARHAATGAPIRTTVILIPPGIGEARRPAIGRATPAPRRYSVFTRR